MVRKGIVMLLVVLLSFNFICEARVVQRSQLGDNVVIEKTVLKEPSAKTSENKSFIENNWKMLVISSAMIILVLAIIIILFFKIKKKKNKLNTSSQK